MTLGEKIRALRNQLGISQRQLAGDEMTRSLISQIEAGKANPSRKNLEIIAKRLGKPPEYFLLEEGYEESVRIVLSASTEDMKNGNLKQAYKRATEALNLSLLSQDRQLEAEALLLVGNILNKMNRADEALEKLEGALEIYKQLNDRGKVASVLLQLGNCCYKMDNYNQASRFYRRCVELTRALKTQQKTNIQALIYLGTVLDRVGKTNESVMTFQEALEALKGINEVELTVQCLLGLGAGYYRDNNIVQAIDVTRQGIALCKAHPQTMQQYQFQFEHNLGVYESVRGNWQEAFTTWLRCLAYYEKTDNKQKQASVKEELAHYWFHMKDYDKAEATCEEALLLLDTADSMLLRGRLYRMIGQIQLQKGNQGRAIEMLRLAIKCFQIIKVNGEIQNTTELLSLSMTTTGVITECLTHGNM